MSKLLSLFAIIADILNSSNMSLNLSRSQLNQGGSNVRICGVHYVLQIVKTICISAKNFQTKNFFAQF